MNTYNSAQCLALESTKINSSFITNIELFLGVTVRFFWLLNPHIKLYIVSQRVIMGKESDFFELAGVFQ